MTNDDKLKFLIVSIVGFVAVAIVGSMLWRSISNEASITAQNMLTIWNPVVALLGGLVGYVAGSVKKGDDE